MYSARERLQTQLKKLKWREIDKDECFNYSLQAMMVDFEILEYGVHAICVLYYAC
jgi:hypothetical protein